MPITPLRSLSLKRETLAVPDGDCVLALPCQEGAGVVAHDISVYGNHGMITDATWSQLPSGLWCLHFDIINDYMTVPRSDSIDLNDVFTFKAWLYRDKAPATYGSYIFSKRDTGSPYQGYMWYVATSGDYPLAGYVRLGAASIAHNSNTGIPLDTWVQVGLTIDGTEMKHFFNGSPDGSVNTNLVPGVGSVDLRIGCYNAIGTGWLFGGYIALPQIMSGIVWSELDFQDSFKREKHLFEAIPSLERAFVINRKLTKTREMAVIR